MKHSSDFTFLSTCTCHNSQGLALMSYMPSFWVSLADVMEAYGELKAMCILICLRCICLDLVDCFELLVN
jgi:hypothetical protein